MELEQIKEREKVKYNLLYSSDDKYGGRTGRAKVFLRGNDEIHSFVKEALLKSSSLLDVGCGKGHFMLMFKEYWPNLKVITGLDIAARSLQKYDPGLKIYEASADDMPFPDSSFDFVAHMDGMEHIPVEMEELVFAEEVRVAKKFIYHTIATHPVKRDKVWIAKGLGAIHINMRTPAEWKTIFEAYADKYRVKIKHFVDYRLWVHVMLEKTTFHRGTVCHND